MPRYFDTLPDELPCLVCHLVVPVSGFRKHFSKAPTYGRGPHTVNDQCNACYTAYRKRTLSPAQLRRWLKVGEAARAGEAERRRLASQAAKKTHREKIREAHDLKTDTLSPFEIAVAELEAAWGKPAAQWTLAEDRLCTLRMYEILGWPTTQTVSDQQHSREVHAAAVRAFRAKQKAERAAMAAYCDTADDDDEALAYA